MTVQVRARGGKVELRFSQESNIVLLSPDDGIRMVEQMADAISEARRQPLRPADNRFRGDVVPSPPSERSRGEAATCENAPTFELINRLSHKGTQAIRCLRCGSVSYNAHDIEHKYCGACNRFHEVNTLA